MVDLFTHSQNQISKNLCLTYAHEQHMQIQNTLKNGENIEANDSILKHIVTKDMVDTYIQMEKKNIELGMYL